MRDRKPVNSINIEFILLSSISFAVFAHSLSCSTVLRRFHHHRRRRGCLDTLVLDSDWSWTFMVNYSWGFEARSTALIRHRKVATGCLYHLLLSTPFVPTVSTFRRNCYPSGGAIYTGAAVLENSELQHDKKHTLVCTNYEARSRIDWHSVC